MEAREVFAGIAIIVALATTCQLLARIIRLPALLLLLPAGFAAGATISFLDPARMFGDLFSPLVGFAVALILFHGGMELFEQPLGHKDRRLIRMLVWVGGAFTWACATLAVLWLFDLPQNLALLVGAILIVSGPTVVGPLLDFVRPTTRIRRILAWEGTLVDPLGALVAVIVFSGVQASRLGNHKEGLAAFLLGIGVGVVGAAVGTILIRVGLRLARGHDVLGTQVLFGAVLTVAGFCDAVADDSGLLAALLMGLAAPKIAGPGLSRVRPFFDTVVSISIGVLFVAISASVTPASLRGLVWPSVALVAILVLVVRPVLALGLTVRTTLSLRERAFIGWMAPRGIVAAATAAGFADRLIDDQIPGGEKLLPITFLVIAGTVTIYSLTAVPVATLLGVRQSDDGPATGDSGEDGPASNVGPATGVPVRFGDPS